MINVHKNVQKDAEGKETTMIRWKSDDTKSAVITDFGISTSIRVKDYKRAVGTAGWAPPEQWLAEFFEW